MIASKASSGNLLVGGGIVVGTGTTGLNWLQLISANSVVIGLAISLFGILAGLAINSYFKNREQRSLELHRKLEREETARHNKRLEELTAQANKGLSQ